MADKVIDVAFVSKEMDESFINEVRYSTDRLQSALKKKALILERFEQGYMAPIMEYFHWVPGQMSSVYFNMPLNKPLFFQKVKELQDLGWKLDGEVSMMEKQVSQNLSIGDYPERVSITLSAVGEGVNCRLVKLQEGKSWTPSVFEWVCEEGAQEMEDQLEEAADEAYVDNEERDSYLDAASLQ